MTRGAMRFDLEKWLVRVLVALVVANSAAAEVDGLNGLALARFRLRGRLVPRS